MKRSRTLSEDAPPPEGHEGVGLLGLRSPTMQMAWGVISLEHADGSDGSVSLRKAQTFPTSDGKLGEEEGPSKETDEAVAACGNALVR